ncbi:efflux RND transporter periplasmic adaptor subunit [Pigmentiphaga aceris]|uniref:Efflux RND transporter periplasmic adaptor subunit n=1 Tax=Pigmentiphaga aceris TaxID=1940612 RepID=A0A5C0B4Q6_9BURK|nr:efflux RND transporter periplasmic adaptor subunit [Pigmentiphaga aceris]QEI07841.1 efflux RND transporter periplasmic adaptor subunit [Pigmentiphaga aceris]
MLAIALAACQPHAEQADPRTGPPLVRVATAGGAVQTERGFTGIVSARVQSELGFRVRGKIVERLVDTGQTVKRSQPLFRVDRTDFALASAAQASTVAAARARALQTASDEKRYRGLVEAGAVSASAYDQMKAAADAADAQLKAAQAQADVLRNEATYAVLLADADGIVVETLAEPGQVVAAGQTVVRVAHAGPREAIVSLPETLRPEVGSLARATLYHDARITGAARLRQLSDAADPRTRTFEARYVLDGAAATAPLGTTVTIHLPDTRGTSAMQVPLAALLDKGQGPGVWVVQGEAPQVVWRPVQVASLGVETAALSGGLNAGERFVALGAHLLHDGERVRIAGEQQAGAASPAAAATHATRTDVASAGAIK